MKVKDVMIYLALASYLVYLVIMVGFWVYMAHMAFALNLYTQSAILTGLFFAGCLFRELGNAFRKTLKEGEE